MHVFSQLVKFYIRLVKKITFISSDPYRVFVCEVDSTENSDVQSNAVQQLRALYVVLVLFLSIFYVP